MSTNTQNTTTVVKVAIYVNGANPNGDPDNGNSPRYIDKNGSYYGVISPFAIKHKIRKSLVFNHNIDVLYKGSDCLNEHEKTSGVTFTSQISKVAGVTPSNIKPIFDNYIDAKAFGFVSAIKNFIANEKQCVSVSDFISNTEVESQLMSITKSISNDSSDSSTGKDSSTMGGGVYRVYDTYYLGELTTYSKQCEYRNFTDDDFNTILNATKTMFDNGIDNSVSRPDKSIYITSMLKIKTTLQSRDIDKMVTFDQNTGRFTINTSHPKYDKIISYEELID